MGLEALAHDRIGRLRLRVPAGHALQLPPEMRALELHPSGLPRSAIVVLRSLRVVRRGATAGARALPGSAWREAAHGAVNEALRGAVRPIDGAVPGQCDAVVFADLAELLACMARDWLDGSLGNHWWWRELFTPAPTPASVCAAWLDNAPALAAAVALLRDECRLEAFVALWPVHERARLLELQVVNPAVVVTRADAAGDAPWPTKAGATAAREDTVVGPPSSSLDGATATSAAKAIPRPAAAATSDVRTASAREIIVPGVVPPPAAAPIAAAGVGSGHDGTADDEASTAVAPNADARTAAEHAPPASRPATPPVATRPDPVAAAGGLDELVQRDERGVTSPGSAWSAVRAVESDTADAGSRAASTLAAQALRSRAPRFESSCLRTEFGGLFYLVNVALHLGLYPDFTQPRTMGLALSPWDLLAWIGRRWFGCALEQDPLWQALASWAGRGPGDEPAAGFVAPAPWQVPEHWLQPFGRPAWLKLRRAGGRVMLRHPAGFSVCDLDASSAVSLPAPDGVTIVELPPRRSGPIFASEGQRWLAQLARLVRARCAIALRVPRRNVPALVARHAAQVLTTPASIEVRLALAGLPLPVRFAGLDRDPGWLPTSGRSLRFVFD